MKYFSMFSGIGGFEYGIEQAYSNQQTAKIEQDRQGRNRHTDEDRHNVHDRPDAPLCIGYSEIDKYAIKVYERNFSGHKNYGNADTIDERKLPDFDLLVGGFPCQAFSIAGKRAGFEDTRGSQFFNVARILAHKRPKHLVLENVKGLLSHDSGKTLQTILGVLSDLGYTIEYQVLNSKDFGVPQNRERIYIVGHLGDKCSGQVFPIAQTNRQTTQHIQGHYSNTLTARYEAAQATGTYIGESGLNAQETDKPKVRRLTPVECMRLQGFPDTWCDYGSDGKPISDSQKYKMAGNAVTTNVVQAVVERLIPCLS